VRSSMLHIEPLELIGNSVTNPSVNHIQSQAPPHPIKLRAPPNLSQYIPLLSGPTQLAGAAAAAAAQLQLPCRRRSNTTLPFHQNVFGKHQRLLAD
jgi:hypothetical protein